MPTAADITNLAALVRELSVHQQALALSDAALVRRYPDLGSPRTWRGRLMAQAWGELDVDAWIVRLRSITDAIDTEPATPVHRPQDPCWLVKRHLAESERGLAERHYDVALAHLAAARRETDALLAEHEHPASTINEKDKKTEPRTGPNRRTARPPLRPPVLPRTLHRPAHHH
ncbi:hypothetical protein [Geminisphaera colitermitum]|uniref:hypothetical protein n=1 Tax=Geminisphaera colitermitum TaxID=1148786 RepID=UPI000158CB9B|nr:hypothetical protein [Geminisphaera colitermitum]